MIKIENVVLPSPEQWEGVIRAMRNPLESWAKSDSTFISIRHLSHDEDNDIVEASDVYDDIDIGPNDKKLMRQLAKAGSDHRKFMRMIPVMMDITAPIMYWKAWDTYKVATVRNSCSTMHKIHAKILTINDFSHEGCDEVDYARNGLEHTIDICERLRNDFNETKEKKYWRALIEILPEGYNMKSTVTLNYEVLRNMYHSRKDHKMDEWKTFCDWVLTLPMSELITGECDEEKIYSFDFCGHHGEVYVPANATETEINAAIFEEMSKMVEITKKYEWTVDKKN